MKEEGNYVLEIILRCRAFTYGGTHGRMDISISYRFFLNSCDLATIAPLG
jgi:hypothetical protein